MKFIPIIIFSVTLLTPCALSAQEEESTSEITASNPHAQKVRQQLLAYMNPEDAEPDFKRMAQLQLIGRDLTMHVGGHLKDELFVYNRVNTLRSDYDDQNDFIRHKLNLDLLITQGEKTFGKPASQGLVRLANYVYWQKESNYTPMFINELKLEGLDDAVAKNVPVKTILPLLFVEQAWFNINFDAFTNACKNKPTSLKVGYFPYTLGRGIAMGYHDDLSVDYLGWAGQGGFTRFAFMPPGILFRTQLSDNLSWDVYFNQWTETNASLSDTLQQTRQQRLFGPQPQRGKGKDRVTYATRLDYTINNDRVGDAYIQPYAVYVHAPEQSIEVLADATAKLFTTGVMADWKKNNVHVNVEVAGQMGHQQVHGLDRNQVVLTRSGENGALQNSFSHVFNDIGAAPLKESLSFAQTTVSKPNTAIPSPSQFNPNNDLETFINAPENRDLSRQGLIIQGAKGPGQVAVDLYNANIFGNARFRNPYRLKYHGFMAVADIDYTFDKVPVKIAAAAGHISGDNYPYNEEKSRSYHGFIPLRSRYHGTSVKSMFIFDRLILPRPLNISYRQLFAYNDTTDLSNLQFLGFGATWFPLHDREKLSVSTDLMFFWEAATLKKWDKNGKHPDPAIETQLGRLRNTLPGGEPTLFSGWETDQNASRHLGIEIDFKTLYRMLDHCDLFAKFALFFPGDLYEDLDGQPNDITRRVDSQGLTRYDSLGHQSALAFILGLNYKF